MYAWFLNVLFKKYPVISILMAGLIIGGIAWLQLRASDMALDTCKVNRSEFELLKNEFTILNVKIENFMTEQRTEQKAMAKYFTGKETFAELPKLPPQEYLIGADTIALRQKYDSCLEARIPLDNHRLSWVCWYHRANKPDTFRVFK